jgi:hypothetical protein
MFSATIPLMVFKGTILPLASSLGTSQKKQNKYPVIILKWVTHNIDNGND